MTTVTHNRRLVYGFGRHSNHPKRINNDLDRIFKSRGWLHILSQTQEPLSFESFLGSAMFHICELKLKVNRIVEKQKQKEAA